MVTNSKEKLASLRGLMKQRKLDAYIVSGSDPHQSEYVAPRWGSRTWLSGFTGSAGVLVITHNKAGLWTDSRYFIQAEKELANSGVELYKQDVPHAPEHLDWLLKQLPAGATLGFDGGVTSLTQARSLEKKLHSQSIHIEGSYDLPGEIWADRPGLPQSRVFEHALKFTGSTRIEKITQLRNWLTDQHADAIFLPALDEIAWILNIRASDIEYNPVCLSYLLVSQHDVIWCVDKHRIDASLVKKLAKEGIVLKNYEEGLEVLQHTSASGQLVVDPATISCTFFEALSGEKTLEIPSPVQAMKAVKNETEINNLKTAMRKDGVALLRLFCWLDEQLKYSSISEVAVAEQLAIFRSEQMHYHAESFGAIVGYKGNGAIVHYRAEAASCAQIKKEGMLLLDSGGQYKDGTTDITRTITLGTAVKEQKIHFTLVLKGMIALSRARFPRGTSGLQLDTLARQYLWQEGLNYGHGTGHGVGFFLNVHEGPQGIMANAQAAKARIALRPGMLTSNEPGFYRQGHYGIRIENLVLCVEDRSTDYGKFLKFETMTLFPIDQNLMDKSLLSTSDMNWLNAYHEKVLKELSPLINEEEKVWLAEKCRKI